MAARFATLSLGLALFASCANLSRSSNQSDGSVDAAADAQALARAESAFAAMSSSSGVKAAFLEAMADDAILFRPGPVNGKTFMAGRSDPAVALEWRPQRVSVAASGELGYSTGPWRLTSKKDASTVEYGQFFTVWRKNSEGRWQVLIDHGISHAEPLGWNAPLETIVVDSGPSPAGTIADAEARFSMASETSSVNVAYRAFGSRSLRILRDEQAPIDGIAAMASAMNASSASSNASSVLDFARWTWTTSDSGRARSSDLGWTMGRYRIREVSGATAGGYFVRVWRVEGGAWKILGDVLAPIEEPAR